VSDMRMRVDVINRGRNVELVVHVFFGQPLKGLERLIQYR
jgi:hypothetical protein